MSLYYEAWNKVSVVFSRELEPMDPRAEIILDYPLSLSTPSRPCDLYRLPSLYPIDVTWSSVSDYSCHMSAVDEDLLAGSTLVQWHATGNSFSLLCLT